MSFEWARPRCRQSERSMPQQVAVQLSTGSLEGCCLPFHPGALISTCGRPSRYPQECKWSGIATWMVNPPFKASSDVSGPLKTVHQPAHDIPHFLRPWDIDLSLRQHPTDLLNEPSRLACGIPCFRVITPFPVSTGVDIQEEVARPPGKVVQRF